VRGLERLQRRRDASEGSRGAAHVAQRSPEAVARAQARTVIPPADIHPVHRFRRLGRLLAVVAAASLTACAVPREAGFPEVRDAVERRIGSRIFWNQGGAADEAVAAKVREMLAHDLTRAEAVQIALLNNRSLQTSYESLTIAQADVVQAGLLKNPVFSGAVRFPVSSASSGPSYDLGVELDFLDLLLIPAKKRVAEAGFEAAKLRVGAEVLRLAHDTRVAFYTLQGAQQVAEMRRAVVSAAEASAALARRQHEAGNISELDLANEEGLYEEVRLDLARSEAEVLEARERMNRLMGLWGDDTRWSVAPKLAEVPAEESPLPDLESLALAQRLDVGAARAELQEASHALAMAESWRFLGGATVGASIQRDPEGVTAAGPAASLELPIFDQKRAAVAKLRAGRRQAELRLAALTVDVRSEVREVRARLSFARSVVERYRSVVVPLRERIVALSQTYHDAMLLGVYQLLLAKRNEVNTYREYIETVERYWIVRADLELAGGGRLSPPSAPSAPRPPALPLPPAPPQHEHHPP
jgi:cobalt-zinc-cadmium efflux system outer membrane protein